MVAPEGLGVGRAVGREERVGLGVGVGVGMAVAALGAARLGFGWASLGDSGRWACRCTAGWG